MLEATRMTLVKARPLPGRFGIAVNVTPEQFGRRAFVDDFIEQVDATAFAPERVTVELTETAPLADPEVARRHAGLLRSAGISIELDDFGAGNNGIRPLCELRGNELLKGIKLDMFYARHYAACSAVRTVTRAVIDLGLEMGLAVTAEGIETPAQARAMLDLGAVFGQGWLWSRALPFDKAVEYLRRNG
jgi:EAL domain-containing protein (putative c-di-GMP-specific phosphodiesterase class I)